MVVVFLGTQPDVCSLVRFVRSFHVLLNCNLQVGITNGLVQTSANKIQKGYLATESCIDLYDCTVYVCMIKSGELVVNWNSGCDCTLTVTYSGCACAGF